MQPTWTWYRAMHADFMQEKGNVCFHCLPLPGEFVARWTMQYNYRTRIAQRNTFNEGANSWMKVFLATPATITQRPMWAQWMFSRTMSMAKTLEVPPKPTFMGRFSSVSFYISFQTLTYHWRASRSHLYCTSCILFQPLACCPCQHVVL